MSARKDHMDALGASLLIGFSAILGLNQALVKLVNAGFSPVFQAGLRSACALLVILVWARFAKTRLNFRDGSMPFGLIAGFLFALEFALLFTAVEYTTVARVSLFFYTMPLFTAVGAHFLFPGEQLTPIRIGGLGLAIAGVALALNDGSSQPGPDAWIGDGLAVLGAIAWAGITLVTRGTRLIESSPEQILLYQLAVSAVLLIPLALVLGNPVRSPTPEILGIFTFQVLAVASLGFLMWMWVLSIYPVTNMASFSLLSPIFGIYFGWLIFNDPLTWRFMAALALVCLGLVFINRRQATTQASSG